MPNIFHNNPLFMPRRQASDDLAPWTEAKEKPLMENTDPLVPLKQSLSRPQGIHYIWDLNEHTLTLTTQTGGAALNSHINEGSWVGMIHPDDRGHFLEIQSGLRATPRPFRLSYRLHAGPHGERLMQVRHSGECSSEADNANNYITGTMELVPLENVPAPPVSSPQYHYPPSIISALEAAIRKSQQTSTTGALLIGSISNLAMILSGYGHETTEMVVNGLLQHIRQNISPNDVVERLGRDQFVVIFSPDSKIDPHNSCQAIYNRIQHYSYTAAHNVLHVICSLGSVEFPTSVTSAADALDKAYIALSFAGEISYRAYEEAQEEAALSRQQMGLTNYLRKAIEHNRIRLAYQPVIESKSGKITHYEALLRLISDDGKITSAGALLPIAERMGLINMVDFLVMEMIVKELEASPDVTLAFNVSNLTTDNAAWLERFQQIMGQKPELAHRIIVEITETAAHRDLRKTAYFVASLQALGCQVALDDFGSGYTSFRQLKALSVDMIKIDGTFIKDITHNADNQFFVRTLLDFTQGFGLKTVAEFVENGEIAKMMMQMGVDYMQGHYFGRPQNNRSWQHQGE